MAVVGGWGGRGEFEVGEAACLALQALAGPQEGVDVELKVFAHMRLAETMLARGRLVEVSTR